MVLSLKDDKGDIIMVFEGPLPDGDYKVTMPGTCFGSGTSRYVTHDQMFQIAWSFTEGQSTEGQ